MMGQAPDGIDKSYSPRSNCFFTTRTLMLFGALRNIPTTVNPSLSRYSTQLLMTGGRNTSPSPTPLRSTSWLRGTPNCRVASVALLPVGGGVGEEAGTWNKDRESVWATFRIWDISFASNLEEEGRILVWVNFESWCFGLEASLVWIRS